METIPIGSRNSKRAMQFAAIGRTDPARFGPSWNLDVIIFVSQRHGMQAKYSTLYARHVDGRNNSRLQSLLSPKTLGVHPLCRILLFSTSVFRLLVVIFAWKWYGADPTRWVRPFVSSVMAVSRLYFHPPRAGTPSPEPMGTRAHVRDSTAGFTRL